MAFPVQDQPLAVALANTEAVSRRKRVDLLSAPADLTAWLELHGLAQGAALAPVRALRDAVRAALGAVTEGRDPPPASLDAINRASAAAPTYPQLGWPPRIRTETLAADTTAATLAAVARSAVELLGGPGRERLRSCAAPGCILLFLAPTARRQWCSPACGTRVRVARHAGRPT